MAPIARLIRTAVAAGLLLALAACGPRISVGPIGDAGAARSALLAASAGDTPVFAEVYGNPYGLDPARRDSLVVSNLAEGVVGHEVRFTTDRAQAPQPEPRLIALLNPLGDPSGDIICTSPRQIHTGAASGELLVIAAFCNQTKLINMARGQDSISGPTDRHIKRLLWRVGGALFPDDYENSYGFNWIPWLDIGIGGSFGF